MPEEQPKKTIDERLEALTMNLEILTSDVHTLQDSVYALRDSQQRNDERERQLREALLRGIAGFIQGLGKENN